MGNVLCSHQNCWNYFVVTNLSHRNDKEIKSVVDGKKREIMKLPSLPVWAGWVSQRSLSVILHFSLWLTGRDDHSLIHCCLLPLSFGLEHITHSALMSPTLASDTDRQEAKSLHAWFCHALYDSYAVWTTLSLFLTFWCFFKEYETWMNYNPEIRYVTSPVTRDLPISYGQIWKLVWWYRSGSQPNVTQVLPWIIPKQCAKF